MGRGVPPMNHPAFDRVAIGGMRPFVMSYLRNGLSFGITLYGTDPGQILEDHCDTLPGLELCGELVSSAPESDDEAWAMIDEYERQKELAEARRVRERLRGEK